MPETKRIPIQQNGKIDFTVFHDGDKIIEETEKFVCELCKRFNEYNLYDLEAFMHEQISCVFWNVKNHGLDIESE